MNGFKWFVASLFGMDGYIKMLEDKVASYAQDVLTLEEQLKMTAEAYRVDKDSLLVKIGELEVKANNLKAENQEMSAKYAKIEEREAKKRQYKADKQRSYRRRKREREQGKA